MDALRQSETDAVLNALRHPLRRRILRTMPEGEAISPRELAEALSQPLSNVSYHVRVLAEYEMLELVGTRQVRGSMQHFYRLKLDGDRMRLARALSSEEPWDHRVPWDESG